MVLLFDRCAGLFYIIYIFRLYCETHLCILRFRTLYKVDDGIIYHLVVAGTRGPTMLPTFNERSQILPDDRSCIMEECHISEMITTEITEWKHNKIKANKNGVHSFNAIFAQPSCVFRWYWTLTCNLRLRILQLRAFYNITYKSSL